MRSVLHVANWALVAAFGLFLSFPIYDFWFFSFISYAIFSYFFLKLSERESIVNVGLFFVFTSTFWFFKRSIELEGVFHTATSYFNDSRKGIFFTLVVFFMLALYSASLYCLSLIIIQKIQSKFIKCFFILFSFIGLAELNDIYIPIPADLVLYQNRFLMASLNFFSLYYYKMGLYLFSLFLALYFKEIKKLRLVFLGLTLWLFASGFIGYLILKKPTAQLSINVVLVQTGQSALRNNRKSIDDYIDEVKQKLPKYFKYNDLVYVFWPESFMEDNDENLGKIRKLQTDSLVQQVHLIGLYQLTDQGIINKMIMLSKEGQIVAVYVKNHLFPIGERSIALPLLPSKWTKVNIPVLNSNIVNSFKINNINFLPLICYESVINKHYKNIQGLIKGDGSDVLVNLSADSFNEESSIIRLQSIYSRMMSSSMGLPMIRVSTTNHTEIISRSGEILKKSQKGTLDILVHRIHD